MTDEELKEYYANLLILQYLEKPNANNTVKYLAGQAIINQLPVSLNNAFDIDTAVGVQLDIIGKYVGAERTAYGFSSTITLSDDDYRQLIYISIFKNNSGSSLYDIQNFLFTYFEGTIFVYDYTTMRIGYFISTEFGSYDLIQMVVAQGLLPKPMAVQLSATIYVPTIVGFFGMRSYELPPSDNISPFNDYLDYQMDWPWLDYNDALLPQYSLLTESSDVIVQESGDLLFFD